MHDPDSVIFTIFVSFRHVPRDLFISGKIVEALNADPRGFRGRRIVDRPSYASLFRDEIDKNLSTVDGELVLWSPEAAESYYVAYEVYRAAQRGVPICLVKYDKQPYPSWWGADRHAIELKGIDARDANNSRPWTDERQMIGVNEFTPFLSACLDFAGQVAKGVSTKIPPVPEPQGWEYGLGWTPVERECPIHRWSVRVFHTSIGINESVYRQILKIECHECEVCQRGLAFSRDRSTGSGDSGSSWSELGEAVLKRHGR